MLFSARFHNSEEGEGDITLKIKLMPAIMTVLSALYGVYVLMSKDTTLVADAVGGDPGGKVLPMMLAIFMFFGFLYITIKERPDEKQADKETKKLFVIMLILTILYVLALKKIGFVISSVVLVYTLEYLFATTGEKRDIKLAAAGGAASVIVSAAVYLLIRLITKTGLSMGKNGTLPAIFASTTFEGCVSLLVLVLITVLLQSIVSRCFKEGQGQKISHAAVITFASVLFLYVVFRQFFSVNLAPGLLSY